MATLSHEGRDGQVQCGLAARGGDRAGATLERGDALLEHGHGRIRKAGVDVAGLLHVEQGRRGVGVREDERGRLVDRNGARTGRRIGRLAGMHRQSVRMR